MTAWCTCFSEHYTARNVKRPGPITVPVSPNCPHHNPTKGTTDD